MAANYASVAFGVEAKKLQEKFGSRNTYARMEKQASFDGLTQNEENFIAERDSFYVASVGENGFPYIQHRGGEKGFLKIVDEHTLILPDFSGNKQYISVGNLATNNKVALLLMDYPHKARLKIYALAEILDIKERHEFAQFFKDSKAERLIKLTVEAFDWNCPQHITQRFSIDEIQQILAPKTVLIEQLQLENKELKEALALLKLANRPTDFIE